MAEPSVLARILGRLAYEFSVMQPMLPTYVHLIVSALFPIYAGAHASLSRPSSAAKPAKRKKAKHDGDASSDEDAEEEHKMEGLAPSDALIMPLLAGCTLAGLYFLLKWLQDPSLLNKLLNGYFALFGVFSVARLITDALDMGHLFLFPRRYALHGALYHVNGKEKTAVPVAGNVKDKLPVGSPLPGLLSKIPLSDRIRELLWFDRAWPGNKWTLRMYLHRVFSGKLAVGAHGLIGFICAVLAVAYFNFVDKPWYLTNLMGFGFSYGALQLMSPTTFSTGSLILGALFFYDIYFVFFTPMMVTVAKSLDVPIKLVFPRPSPTGDTSTAPSHAMLGLGDVVLPGIMIGLALRFDLFLFYLRRQARVMPREEGAEATVNKPKYFSVAGQLSDRFWTHTLAGRPLFGPAAGSKPEPPFTFPKTYFKASLIGYVLGMLTTLGVMQTWGHAQPALLYLVPGVLGSLWLTAALKGELGLMWEFSEAIEEEDEDSANKPGEDKKTNSSSERSSFFSLSDKKSQEREARMNKAIRQHVTIESESEHDGEDRVKKLTGHRSDREVFSFSIESPYTLKQPQSVAKVSEDAKAREEQEEQEQSPVEKDKPNWAPPASSKKTTEQPQKRVRLK
ncbi:intramembrane protease 2 [Massariosphaeria phaeospora]|uniref:Intramembrane protease 2 n=1 Tax=Massariosphaeria phaeospora TaxID=100035 RepID=A0A7C8MAJ7_9PLEO|nr:intramembrane protease 2 [Massariosphaeria phaeospora]